MQYMHSGPAKDTAYRTIHFARIFMFGFHCDRLKMWKSIYEIQLHAITLIPLAFGQSVTRPFEPRKSFLWPHR